MLGAVPVGGVDQAVAGTGTGRDLSRTGPAQNEPVPESAEVRAKRKAVARAMERRRRAVAELRLAESLCGYAAGQLANGLSAEQARLAALETAGALTAVAAIPRRGQRLGLVRGTHRASPRQEGTPMTTATTAPKATERAKAEPIVITAPKGGTQTVAPRKGAIARRSRPAARP